MQNVVLTMTQDRLSNAFLDLAEIRAERHLITTMSDWKNRLDNFLSMNDYEVLQNAGFPGKKCGPDSIYQYMTSIMPCGNGIKPCSTRRQK